MSCEHAETTVLLYLFGEAPPEYADHLDGCEACQSALLEHADTVALVGPALCPPAELPAPPPAARWEIWGTAIGAGLALAAGLAMTFSPAPPPPPAPTPVARAAPDLSWDDPMAGELHQLDAQINALATSMETNR
jgi:hypothetical protein